ncbi:hypothetical protein ACR9E3_03670 [Actinomycetospora sp. C-140]
MSWIFRTVSFPLAPSFRGRGESRRREAVERAFEADLRREFRAACEFVGVRTRTHVPAGVTITTPRIGEIRQGPPTVFTVELMAGMVPSDLLPPARRVAEALGGRGVRLEPLAGRWLRVVVLDDPGPPADRDDPARPGPRRVRSRPLVVPCTTEGSTHSIR